MRPIIRIPAGLAISAIGALVATSGLPGDLRHLGMITFIFGLAFAFVT
jgi:hypothetical protein